jgi:hypothetical protein
MKFEDAKVGMLVSVTGPHSVHFPKGAEVIEKCDTDLSIKTRNNETGFKMYFFEPRRKNSSIFSERYSMEDIYPLVEDTSTKPYFRKLPPTTLKVATYLGLDAENVTCYVDKENGTVTVRQGDKEAKAKKAPQDKWDFRLSMGLALCRLKEKLTEHQKPDFYEPCYYVLKNDLINHTIVGLGKDFLDDIIMYAMGNTFKTEQLAKDNMEEMMKRTNMIVDFCKKQGW